MRATESVVVISLRAVMLAWIRRPRLSQNPNHLRNLFGRSNVLPISGASHGYCLLCNSHSGTDHHAEYSTTMRVDRHYKVSHMRYTVKPLWYSMVWVNIKGGMCFYSQTLQSLRSKKTLKNYKPTIRNYRTRKYNQSYS